MTYEVILNDTLEDFLTWYLAKYPLRPEHKRQDYPNLVVNNFVNGMMRRMRQEGLYCRNCMKAEA